jgi:murein L,D-transpeptidase YafK
MKMINRIFLSSVLLISSFCAIAQSQQRDFLKYQKSFRTVSEAFYNYEDSLKAQFAAKGLAWPAKYLYIRSFKFDSQLEVWVKDKKEDPFVKFKTYKICALAGNLGPKRFEGDYQVPEGFYYFNQFKPNSNYHLALGINYPNASDRMLSDSIRPGAAIFVHGSCVTVGCIPLRDQPIEELYVLAASTHSAGQDYIPIHVFPIKFKKAAKHKEMMDKYLAAHPEYKPMMERLMDVYFYFEQHKKLPVILVNKKGDYLLGQEFKYTPPKVEVEKKLVENSEPRKKAGKVKSFGADEFYPSVYKMPVFPGGNPAFQVFLDNLSAELSDYLPEAKKRIFVQVDFVIDKEGNLVNVQVADNANNEINNRIIQRFEALPQWEPAVRQTPVAIKLQQSIMIEAKIKPKAAKTEEDDD